MDALGGDLLPREGVHLSLQVLQPLSAHGSCGVTWGSTSHLQISEGPTLSCNQWSGGSDWPGSRGRWLCWEPPCWEVLGCWAGHRGAAARSPDLAARPAQVPGL